MTPDEKRLFAQSFPVHVGVDTGKQFHVLVARGPDGTRSKPFRADVSREATCAPRPCASWRASWCRCCSP